MRFGSASLLLAFWKPGLGVLEARLSVLEARLGVLEARLGVLEAGLVVSEAGLSVLEARLGVVGRPGKTSWCIPMRFYKVFGVKTRPMGLKAKKHHFSNGISMNFVFLGHRIVPWAYRSAPLAHNMASWRPDRASWRLDWAVLTSTWVTTAWFYNVLDERESLNYHWFWEIWGGPKYPPSQRGDFPTP